MYKNIIMNNIVNDIKGFRKCKEKYFVDILHNMSIKKENSDYTLYHLNNFEIIKLFKKSKYQDQ